MTSKRLLNIYIVTGKDYCEEDEDMELARNDDGHIFCNLIRVVERIYTMLENRNNEKTLDRIRKSIKKKESV
jgi:hypothetical protein